ncbi:MAG TPA: cyanophycinase [Phycisphaerales bacterium]|nr:cyanophycinase [Phycisphaerales bacterium]
MKDTNAAVYGRLMELAGEGATIGVVPTATGVENPGAATVQLLKTYAKPSQTVVLLPLTKDDGANADKPEVADQIRACRGLWFVGGDQSRITAVFRPPYRLAPTVPGFVEAAPPTGHTPSLAYEATLDVLRGGGVIAGTSAGAAMMSSPMITGGSTEGALNHGAVWSNDPTEEQGVGLASGMGYFPYGLLDQHFLERGRLGRLLVAMHAADIHNAWAIRENGCLEVDLATGRMRAIGPYAVVHVRLPKGTRPDDGHIPNVELMPREAWEKVQLGD